MPETSTPDYSRIIDQETWAFIEKTNRFYPPDTITRSIVEQRQSYDEMSRSFHPVQPANVLFEDTEIQHVSVRIYTPNVGNADVTVIYAHGGGFMYGGLESHHDVCAEICEATSFRVVAVDYRLVPEYSINAAIDDCASVLKWVRGTGRDNRIILVGDSAGGALSAAISHENRRLTAIIGQVLIYPGLGGSQTDGSLQRHTFAPLLTRDEVLYFRAMIEGMEGAERLNLLSKTRFDGLPVTVAFSAECDPLSDEAQDYVSRINGAGGEAYWIEDAGLVHGHLRARFSVKRARKSFDRVLGSIKMIAAGKLAPEKLNN